MSAFEALDAQASGFNGDKVVETAQIAFEPAGVVELGDQTRVRPGWVVTHEKRRRTAETQSGVL